MLNGDVLRRLDGVETTLDILNAKIEHAHDMLHEIARCVEIHPETLRQLQLKLQRSTAQLQTAINLNQGDV